MINGNIDEFVEKLSGNVKRKWNGWTNKKIPLGATNTQGNIFEDTLRCILMFHISIR